MYILVTHYNDACTIMKILYSMCISCLKCYITYSQIMLSAFSCECNCTSDKHGYLKLSSGQNWKCSQLCTLLEYFNI